MRNFKLTSLLVLFYGIMTGQCITNSSLDATCITNGGYNNNCVSGWTASHGTPTTAGTVGGNTWAWMWSRSGVGEGILTNYNFELGRTYQVSFKVRASSNVPNSSFVMNSSLNAVATAGITGSSNITIPTPSTNQSIWSSTATNLTLSTSWTTIIRTFTPSNNFSQLWLYPSMITTDPSNSLAQIQMEVDDIVVTLTNASPAFTFNSYCASNGTISVTATAQNNSAGINHWWGLMETNAAGVITDAATIGQVGAIQSGNTVTFTGLTASKNYYIKHGVYGNCVTWNEIRTALPKTVGWSNYTTNFNVAPSANLNGTISVTVQAHNNPVFVYHHWSIFYAPNGSTAGNTNVPNNPDQCCNNATATFSNNLVVNEWYYIKHGIWNDCSGWGETRKAFRVVIQGLTAAGNPNYAIEEMVVSPEDPNILNKSSKSSFEVSALSPNPASSTDLVRFKTNVKEIESIQLIDFMNATEKIKFNRVNDETIEFSLGSNHKSGIYVVKVIYKDQSVVTKKLVIQ